MSLPVLVALVAALFIGSTALGLAIGYGIERWCSRRVWSVAMPATQLRHEVRGNVTFVAVSIATLSLVLHFDIARTGVDSAARAALTFIALVFGFQLFYYALHRALHTHALVRFHRHHHESHVTTPLSGQSTSFVEAVGWMLGYAGLPIALSYVAPISVLGWLGYLAFNVVGNIVGHANAEVIAPSRFLWWRSSVAGVITYHALHHARWTGHYAFESTWADRLFGTEWHDWPTLHARIWAGRPLASLKERASPDQQVT